VQIILLGPRTRATPIVATIVGSQLIPAEITRPPDPIRPRSMLPLAKRARPV
jgi:hypothetical protein